MQKQLFQFPKSQTAHGGSLTKGKRKAARPIAVKESMHVIMRATAAQGNWSLLLPRNAKNTFYFLTYYAKRFYVKIYHFAFVGNHLHLIVKAKTREGFKNFLRVFAGQSAQNITRAKKGAPLTSRFWDLLVYTRIIVCGRAFKYAENYIRKNVIQGSAIRRVSFLSNTS